MRETGKRYNLAVVIDAAAEEATKQRQQTCKQASRPTASRELVLATPLARFTDSSSYTYSITVLHPASQSVSLSVGAAFGQ